ncbi:hypothetical protein HYFRA_00002155 [Hymenoscyphus fraxineus]|uniref:Uncharacterized protein n=1 Tax=Hymenoscyphus fraxineus TaxID=746836 RepID=A0A9N9PP35_9HELO|nr:hypothetical protein HYFRA_00002155 [Hymenoscyphus fraxineus]
MDANSILDPSLDEKTSTSSGYLDFTKQWIEGTYSSWFGENRTSSSLKDAFKKRSATRSDDIDTDVIENTFYQRGLRGF